MDVTANSSSSQKLVNFTKPTPDFNQKFYNLFCQKSMVDVTLSAEGQFLQAHKVVLAVTSSWFEVSVKLFQLSELKLKIEFLGTFWTSQR